MSTPPVCDYEGSHYQQTFWDKGTREYEDRCEDIAIRKLLPRQGYLLLELGAGAGRNTKRYTGYERVVLLDYSTTQLKLAQERLGSCGSFSFVAADIYKLPFTNGLFDGATMIRTLHHMSDPIDALKQVRRVLQPGSVFILEFANKQNLKAILRYIFRRQQWNPFSPKAVEFAELNFNFHPREVFHWLTGLDFQIDKIRTVSHFRLNILKRITPPRMLAALDGFLQPTGALIQLTPSVFLRASFERGVRPNRPQSDIRSFFSCPECGHHPLESKPDSMLCIPCDHSYPVMDGIFDFRGKT